MLVKIIIAECQGIAKAAPTATPRKGAMHGVATIVARKPEKNEPRYPDLPESLLPTPVKDIPISKTPLKLRAKINKKTANPNTKIGSCN